MTDQTPQVAAARSLAANAAAHIGMTPAFQALAPETQAALLRDLGTIRRALDVPNGDPYAFTMETPFDRRTRARPGAADEEPAEPSGNGAAAPAPRAAATETIAARAGALSDEIDFPAFVAGLVHGTFDAIVDATIRQMEAFASLVSAVARDAEQFTRDNVTINQVRDWLAEQYPQDLVVVPGDAGAGAVLRRRALPPSDEEPAPPAWLADFGLEGEDLTDELIEERLLPLARRRLGEDRLSMLATMVLLGMNRVVVRDGSISARLRFRASAADKATVDYAVSQDPGQPGRSWGARGSGTYQQHTTMVSTVGVNAQAQSELRAELFGEVRINFASETLPLERFADSARMTLLQRNARWAGVGTTPAAVPTAAPPPAVTPPATATPATPPAPVASPAPPPAVSPAPVAPGGGP